MGFSGPAKAGLGPCYGEFGKVLSASGFTGPDCSLVTVRIQKIGLMKRSHDALDLYVIFFKTIPEPGLVAHGRQSLVVLSNQKFLGQYSLSLKPSEQVTINGTKLNFAPPIDDTDVDLGDDGLPPTIWMDRDNFELSK